MFMIVYVSCHYRVKVWKRFSSWKIRCLFKYTALFLHSASSYRGWDLAEDALLSGGADLRTMGDLAGDLADLGPPHKDPKSSKDVMKITQQITQQLCPYSLLFFRTTDVAGTLNDVVNGAAGLFLLGQAIVGTICWDVRCRVGLPRYLGSSRSLDNPSWQIAELGFKGAGMKCASNPTNWGCSKRYKKDKADVSKPCNAMPSVCKIVLSCPAAMVDGNLWGLFWALLASTKRQEDR